VPDVAEAGAGLVHLGYGLGAGERDHLEREAGGGGERVGADLEGAVSEPGDDLGAQRRLQPRLVRQREQRAHLHPRGPDGQGGPHLIRAGVAAGEPEGQPDRGDPGQVGLVTGTEHGLPVLVDHEAAAGRGVVAPRARPLDHEAVRPGDLVAGQPGGEHLRGDDGEEHRPAQRGEPAAGDLLRVELGGVGAGGAVHVKVQRNRLMAGEPGEEVRDLRGDTRTHQHVVHAGEQGAVRRTRGGELDLLQEVDAHEAVVALLGEPDLHEVGDDAEHLLLAGGDHPQLRDGCVGLAGRATLRAVVLGQHLLGHRGDGEVGERAADVPAGVPVLEATGDDDVEGGPGHHAELAGEGHRPGELPRRDSDAHAALDDGGERAAFPIRGGQVRGGRDGQCC